MVSELILNSSNLIDLFKQVKHYPDSNFEKLLLMLNLSVGFTMINEESKAHKVLASLEKMLKKNNTGLHFSK